MIKYSIFGERSKISYLIRKYIPSDFLYTDIDSSDVVFICARSSKAEKFINENLDKNFSMIDLSGVRKIGSDLDGNGVNGFSYGMDIINNAVPLKKHIANTGCISRGVLYAMFPIIDILLKDVFIHTLFSQSALSNTSELN